MKKAIKLTAILLTLVMLMGVVSSCDIPLVDDLGNFTGLHDIINMFTGDDNVLVASSQNFEVYSGAAKYFFMDNFNGFTKTYSLYTSVFAIDANMPLEEQYVQAGSVASSTLGFSGTWLSYFVNETMRDIDETLALCEYALAHGIECEVTDADISAAMSSFGSSYSSVSHICMNTSEDNARDYLKLKKLADAARARIAENLSDGVTDFEIEKYAVEFRESYECIDVVVYEFSIYRQDFESYSAFEEQIRSSEAHMEYVCSADTPEEFVKRMNEKSDDVADYLKKGYRRSDISAAVEDILFNGDIGTAAYGQNGSGDEKEDKVTMTAYMRCSDVYFARTRNYYYATFKTEEQANTFISKLDVQNMYYELFMETASMLDATSVESMKNQTKSAIGSNIVYKYEFSTDSDSVIKYYASSAAGATDSYTNSYVIDSNSSDIKYSYTTGLDGVYFNPQYTVVNPDGTIINGNTSVIIGNLGTSLFTSAVDNWVFDSAREVGDYTDTPISINGEYAVIYYRGEGEFCYISEARNQIVGERVQAEVENAMKKVSVSYEENLESLFATPKKSSGIFGF